ncbi:hypothetical protein R3P38DRAFT_2782587 [Favolaschia claudopus]|uniref:Uncharacterized protein n=1 Tax=Favolaschia claudopus TaxID=2862362 RepID=A0AAW0B0Q7_9AGAR
MSALPPPQASAPGAPAPAPAPVPNTTTPDQPSPVSALPHYKALSYDLVSTTQLYGLPDLHQTRLLDNFKLHYIVNDHPESTNMSGSRVERLERSSRIRLTYDIAAEYFRSVYEQHAAEATQQAAADVAAAAAAAEAEASARAAGENVSDDEAADDSDESEPGEDPPLYTRIPWPTPKAADEAAQGTPNWRASLDPQEQLAADDDDEVALAVDVATPVGAAAMEVPPIVPPYLQRAWSQSGLATFFPVPGSTRATRRVPPVAPGMTAHSVELLDRDGVSVVLCQCVDGNHRTLQYRQDFAFVGPEGETVIKRARKCVTPLDD